MECIECQCKVYWQTGHVCTICVCVCVLKPALLFISDLAPSVTVSVGGLTNVLAGTSQTLTCSVGGIDLTAAAVLVISVMHTWLHDSTVVHADSTSNQYIIPPGSLRVSNAGDVYTCRVAITASYWDVSGSFGDSSSGTLTIISKSINKHCAILSVFFLNNLVPNPTIVITVMPFVRAEYVGLNYTLRCEAEVPGNQLDDIDAVMEWMKDGIKLSSSNNGRVTLGDTREDSPGREFRRSIVFSPLSAGDMGSYSCSATIRPTVDNPGVTNGFGILNSNLTIAGKFNNSCSIIGNFLCLFSTHFGCLYRSYWCPSSSP